MGSNKERNLIEAFGLNEDPSATTWNKFVLLGVVLRDAGFLTNASRTGETRFYVPALGMSGARPEGGSCSLHNCYKQEIDAWFSGLPATEKLRFKAQKRLSKIEARKERKEKICK